MPKGTARSGDGTCAGMALASSTSTPSSLAPNVVASARSVVKWKSGAASATAIPPSGGARSSAARSASLRRTCSGASEPLLRVAHPMVPVALSSRTHGSTWRNSMR